MAARVLLTRPRDRGESLLADCQALGIDCAWWPLQTIEALPCAAPVSEPIPHAIIVVSAHAAIYGVPLLPARWRASALIAVGKATAQQLTELGWPQAQTPATENSEHLLALPVLAQVRDQRIVLLRGDRGRELIGDTLRERGARLDTLIVYRTVGPTAEAAAAIANWAQQPGTIVISSTQALQQLCAIIPPTQRAPLRLLCLGERIAAAAQPQFAQVGVISALTATTIKNAL